jgi:hypothetical protein
MFSSGQNGVQRADARSLREADSGPGWRGRLAFAPLDLPLEDIEACVDDEALQREGIGALDEQMRRGLELLRTETLGNHIDERICWVFFRSPEWSWRQEAGVEGWLLFDHERKEQRAFITTAIS